MHLVLIIRLLGCIENDNAYGALSMTFPTMHISADRKLLPKRHP